MPLIGITIARISRGRSIRAVILGTLGAPFAITLILCFTRLNGEIPPLAAAFIAGLGLLGLLCMTLHKKVAPSFILVYLPRQDQYKFRPYASTFTKVLQMAIGFLFIYLPGGMTIIHFFFFAAALPLIIMALSPRLRDQPM